MRFGEGETALEAYAHWMRQVCDASRRALGNTACWTHRMRAALQRALAPVAIAAVLSLGCSTTYAPGEPGRISLVMSGLGEEALKKDGKDYKIGGFSGDLLEAVSGNSAAEAHARKYVRRQRISTSLGILTGVALLVGACLVAFGMAEPMDSDKPVSDSNLRMYVGYAGLSLLLGSLVSAAGAAALGIPEGDLHDAINIYNDDVASRQRGFSGDEHANDHD
jgi:hypothetical protein